MTGNLHAANSSDYQPFDTRDQNVFNLIHGQALPTNAKLLKKKQSRWSVSLVTTNTLNIETEPDESIYLDYESYRLNLAWQYGLTKDWNLKIDIPLIRQTGGHFDSAIYDWHDIFGLRQGNRPFVEDNQYQISYADQNQSLLNLNESSNSLGDIQIALSHALIENSSTTISLWSSLKLATGDEDKLSSNGATDFSIWLAINQKLSELWRLNINTGAVMPGASDYKGIPLTDVVGYGHAMLGVVLNDTVELKLQLQGHSSYYEDSQTKILGSTYFATFGGTIKLSQCHQIEIGFSEDIKIDASPDASLIISWRRFPSAC